MRAGNGKQTNWKFECDSEVSVIGSCFAEAVTLMATHQHDHLKQVKVPSKKVFWEESKYNPPLQNTHITSGFEAHFTEERLHWSRKGKRFPPELPQPSREKDKGPKKPEEFPKIFEKSVVVVPRSNKSTSFLHVYKASKSYSKVYLLLKVI